MEAMIPAQSPLDYLPTTCAQLRWFFCGCPAPCWLPKLAQAEMVSVRWWSWWAGAGGAILCSQLIIIADSYTAWGVHIDFYHLCLCFLTYQKIKIKNRAFLQISHTLGRAKPFLAVFPALGPIAAIVPERLCQGAEWCDRKSINLCCVNSQLCHVQLYDLGQVIYFLCFTETLPKVTFGIPDSKTSV